MDVREPSKEEQQACDSNIKVHANPRGKYQTIQSIDHERGVPTERRDLATASSSSPRPTHQNAATSIESQSTRLARIDKPPIGSFSKEYKPESWENLWHYPDSGEDFTDDKDLDNSEPANNPQNQGFHYKGRLPREAPCFVEMEEQATQPATQPYLDPRRHGDTSILSEEDVCDVLCILHPTSTSAIRAKELVADYTPQHILQIKNPSRTSRDDNGTITESSTRSGIASLCGSMLDEQALESKPQGASESNGRAVAIALRLSSKLIDPCLGFTFGRSQLRSDILIGSPEEMKISTRHFRIYLNSAGIPMLEDTSKNGTLVDSVPLRANPAFPEAEKRRMLNDGAMISVMLNNQDTNLEDSMSFIVKMPRRGDAEDRWNEKILGYVEYINQTERQRAVRAESSQQGAATAILPPMKPLGGNGRQDSAFDIDPTRTIMAGGKLNVGIEWSGGEKYNVVGKLGSGAFAVVYKLATKRDGDLYAVKQIEKRKFIKNGVLDNKIKNEMHIMKDLEHPHIVKFIGHEETSRHLLLIMELVPFGDLSVYITSGGAMPEYSCQRVAWQICSALDYLHKRNITHRDIKPENILIQSKEPLNVKLSDFGLSKRITNEDAFLQTFCGTILYCAPEIYPGYDQYKNGRAGKRRRPTDPPLKTIPYQQSVDIWALAAVLYHLLCACPPYAGTASNHGAAMLHTVMNSKVDLGKLRSAGVSDEGIDFVSRMLKHDPLARATEAECLQHPWIAGKAVSKAHGLGMERMTSLGAIPEDQDELDSSQLSQLSLTGNPRAIEIEDSDMEYESDVDETEIADARQSKRLKANNEGNHGKQREMTMTDEDVTYPSLIGVPAGVSPGVVPGVAVGNQLAGTPRLFGEIGPKALRSSATLGYDARAALNMIHQESQHGSEQESRDSSASPTHSLTMTMKDRHVSTTTNFSLLAQHQLLLHPHTHPHPLPHHLQPPSPPTGSAPSLLGAEAMVGQLNMASPELAVSAPSSDTMNKTPPLSESPAASSNRSSQVFPSTDESTPKRVKLSRPSGTEPIGSTPRPQDTASANEQARPILTDTSTAHEATTKPACTAPRLLLGIIATIPGSVCDTTIKLDKRFTHYGRDPAATYRYMDKLDVRVPKHAMDIIWWCPGLDAMMAAGQDWREVEGLCAIIHTRTSQSIKVNDTRLTRGNDCWNFGRLRTGDIITIFAPDKPKDGKGEEPQGRAAEFLKFRCEFFVGPSAKPREEAFVVEKERTKYKEHQQRLARRRRLYEDSQASQSSRESSAGNKRTAEQAMGGAQVQGRDVAGVTEAGHGGGQDTPPSSTVAEAGSPV